MDKVDHGIKVNGININNLRYADDTVLIAASQEKQQILISRVIESCNKYGLRLNTSKTKVMVDNKTPILPLQISAYGTQLEKVNTLSKKYKSVSKKPKQPSLS